MRPRGDFSNSRGPETLFTTVFAIGGGKAGTVNEAAAFGDSVLMGIPLKNYKSIPVRPLAGKIVVDANNYYPARDGNITELDSETGTSSELLAAHLPDSTTIKASNAITMADLEKDGLPPGSPNGGPFPWRVKMLLRRRSLRMSTTNSASIRSM